MQIVKLAREHGVEELLPETTKGTEYQLAQRVEHGLRVKGTGVGQKVKGHIHERHMIAKYVNSSLSVWISSLLDQFITNNLVQDGTEEESHAGNAKTHPGLEECKNHL
jgi:large subunit ribosomal protein L25